MFGREHGHGSSGNIMNAPYKIYFFSDVFNKNKTQTGGEKFNRRLLIDLLAINPISKNVNIRSWCDFVLLYLKSLFYKSQLEKSASYIYFLDCSNSARDIPIILFKYIFNIKILLIVHHRSFYNRKSYIDINIIKHFSIKFCEYIQFTFSDTIIVPSNATSQQIPFRFRWKIFKINPPLEEFKYRKKTIPHQDVVGLTFIGSIIDPRKNFAAVFDAIAILNYAIKLHVICKDDEYDDAHIMYNKENIKFGQQKQIQFYRNLEKWEIQKVFDQTHIYLQPSLWEGFGMAAAEAIMAGAPVIATNVGGLNEAVEHQYTGHLLDDPSPVEIAQAIVLLVSNTDVFSEMSINCENRSFEYRETIFSSGVLNVHNAVTRLIAHEQRQ
jgi:glycosyltransferase involved in cell wall biosynthesis